MASTLCCQLAAACAVSAFFALSASFSSSYTILPTLGLNTTSQPSPSSPTLPPVALSSLIVGVALDFPILFTGSLMGIGDTDGPNISGATKKTQVQLQSLEKLYSEEKYPKQNKLEEYASSLNLTYNQVRVWFAERRRKERRMHNDLSSSIISFPNGGLCGMTDMCSSYAVKKMSQVVRRKNRHKVLRHLKNNSDWILNQVEKNHLLDLQTLVSKDYILSKIFRKDGPMLGMDFDFPPGDAFGHCTGSHRLQPYQDDKQILERKKAMVPPFVASNPVYKCSLPEKKHGMGKGLMTVWRATQADVERPPTGMNYADRSTWLSLRISANKATRVSRRVQKKESQLSSQKRSCDKRKQLRKVSSKNDVNKKEPQLKDCKLSLDGSLERSSELMTLVDDEELELNELQAGPNPLRCSAHLASSGRHGCPLCKDLLARFPPKIVKMKQLFSSRPWDSSPEVVKKLFKVLQFIYSHSTVTEVCPFTVDEFAQAFHDKDSLLLGKVHVALLQFLISGVQKDITSRSTLRTSKVCRFLVFLDFVREQVINITFWSQSLNSLTWAEILRQVLIAAGFGGKQSIARRGNNKERNQMEKYGLSHRTLKGELFSLLSKQGSGGLKISELAIASQIVELDLPSTTEELEKLIYSTLSSDITLFEKIAPSAYRLRVDPQIKGKSDSQSDTDDSGSVDDDSCDATASCSSDDAEVDSTIQDSWIVKYNPRHMKTSKKLIEYTEIDESYTGEAWVQGLMEGEYSNLSIEEKLNALGALIDLVGACSSLTTEEPSRAIFFAPNVQYRGSGAKIKRKFTNSQMLTMPLLEVNRPRIEATCSLPNTSPTDPSAAHPSISCTMTADLPTTSKGRTYQTSSSGINNIEEKEACIGAHPLQCIHLGSDRRYNNYWLFLGPCTAHDPGHRRVYFESSEDGHWKVIDTAEALCVLLSILDDRGTREACLIASLENRKSFLCRAMDEYMASAIANGQAKSFQPSDIDATSGDGSSPTSDVDNVVTPAESHDLSVSSSAIDLEIGRNNEEKKKRWERFQSYDKWVWNTFYSNLNAVKYSKRSYLESLTRCENCHDLFWRDEKHCKTCHTTFEIDFDLEERYAIHIATCREHDIEMGEFPKHKVLPSQLQVLKASIHAIEASMPEAALAGTWNTSTHKLWVKRLRRASSLPELLQVLTDFVGALNEDWLSACPSFSSDMAADDVIIQFQTMPQTTSAVALWIFKLDTLIAPNLERIQGKRSTKPVPQLKRRRTC